ncbi:hypothetical protein D9Q98_001048 [Chlorella vulgaris]|uniref:SWIM-type domain-containing protein n=1 Tax=Chlorella vulgaris TaxID=3077 RepID=A0A9D4Z304_CHLVU|nr:hypothetical protein D9Q98_001048 [Chlorella vulgaris]
MERNRQRLMSLGIPALKRELEEMGSRAAVPREVKKRQRVKPKGHIQPTRHSTRLQKAKEQPKESASERFERELGEFVVSEQCPRCGRVLQRGHRRHLQACPGALQERPAAAAARAEPRPRDAAMEDLDAEERQDQHRRLLARMSQLHLEGITELSEIAAKFVVLGSARNHYTVTLTDPSHTCTCPDYRFRRHDCKHISLCLQQLGVFETPHREWKAAVEARMSELVQQLHEAEPPRSKEEEVALKLL